MINKTTEDRRRRVFFGTLKNDLEYITIDELSTKIYEKSHFSILYFVLLSASVVVCTLGLLTNNTAVVIGGMLIAPLTWPLSRVGLGVARSNPKHIYRGALLVAASILIGAISAYIITTISPLKIINEEILARTSPTLMDLFVALSAGLVAAISITQKKIADSLAGVAIAASLMPPLCAVGITLSLNQLSFSFGALLLFLVNATCITLVTAIVISFNTYLRTKKFKISTRGTILNLVLVLVLAVPLALFLNNYTFEVKSYDIVSAEMTKFIEEKDKAATFENIRIESPDKDIVSIYSDLLLPNDSVFSYEDSEQLSSQLERLLGKKVEINLRIQSILEPITKDQQENEALVKLLSDKLTTELTAVDSSYKISSISVLPSKDEDGWSINAQIFSDPEAVPDRAVLSEIDETITNAFKENVELNLTFVPLLTLRSSEQTQTQEAREVVEEITNSISSDAEISSFIMNIDESKNSASFTVIASDTTAFNEEYLQNVKNQLGNIVNGDVSVRLRLLTANDIQL